MCECCKCGSVKVEAEKLRLMIGEKLAEWSDDPKLASDRREDKPLLMIVQQDINSVPEVYYEGENLEFQREINFEWESATHVGEFGTGASFDVEYYDKETDKVIKKGYQHKFR